MDVQEITLEEVRAFDQFYAARIGVLDERQNAGELRWDGNVSGLAGAGGCRPWTCGHIPAPVSCAAAGGSWVATTMAPRKRSFLESQRSLSHSLWARASATG